MENMVVKVSTSFISQEGDQEFGGSVGTILTCLTNNQFYTDPSPTLAVITTAWKAFTDACTAAAGAGGGTTLTAAKNERRAELEPLVRSLAGYVQANCQGSLAILLSSGFPNQKTERQPIGQLPAPQNVTLALGSHSGELDAAANPVYGASIYNWQLMAANAPTVVLQTAQTTCASNTFDDLTPGTVYLAQVNAVGTAGPSDWAQSAPQMAV
jgi:hypothetical protein